MGAACPSIDHRPILEYLTGFHVCTSMPSDPGEVFTNVAKLFTSLRQALHVLFEFYKNLPNLYPHLPEQYFPLRNTFLTTGGDVKKVKYKGVYPMEKNTWKAALETRDGSLLAFVPVLVKFTRHYSATSHRILESSGLAPKLYYCDSEQNPEPEEGTAGLFFWRMVVVEDFSTTAMTLYDFTTTKKPSGTHSRQIAEQLRRAVGLLHSENYVFGDLRSINVMISHDICEAEGGQGGRSGSEEKKLRVWLVNFDWAGKVGKARYPSGISFEGIPWPESVVPKGLITKDHDLYWLGIWADLLS
ncbi:hypothetical protein L218DRAFT_931822 [Marasmius fiardii PR-910]|nr:hypothetical protein L218DRAFT_931822 [Marasmius fiardii PR-910]